MAGPQPDAPGPVSSQAVPKPISRAEAENPREFQIQQLRRRFSPIEEADGDGTKLAFRLVPSDPDFPFELDGLDCVLHVPFTYPGRESPRLEVKNKEMGRGYQINVERGFDEIVTEAPQGTLLGAMNRLDRRLESMLIGKKAETVKIVPNTARTGPRTPVEASKITQDTRKVLLANEPQPAETRPSYSAEQKRDAQARRELETRQLEARLGRLDLFAKSPNGTAYTVPIDPRRRGDLPVPLQGLRKVQLYVPSLYPLETCKIEIQGIARGAATVTENAFEKRARENRETSLMGHVNFLAQNIHVLATRPTPVEKVNPPEILSVESLSVEEESVAGDSSSVRHDWDSRSHIKVISRPPEWLVGEGDQVVQGDHVEGSDSYDSEDEFADDASEHDLENIEESIGTSPERGILLSFPFLELYGIELLELVSIGITIKCERCKDTMDVKNLRNNITTAGSTGIRTESCKKCADTLGVGNKHLDVGNVKATVY